MKAAIFLTSVLLASTATVRADFSYTTNSKTTGGAMAALAGGNAIPSSKHYFKGQKMKTETGDNATIIDFDAQTITTVNHRQKTVSVRSLKDILPAGKQNETSVKIDVKETGQKKTINGYNASELVMTMDMDNPQAKQMGKMRMEMDMWLSTDVPGISEMRDFYKANMERMPWAAMSAGNQGIGAGMAEMQRKMAEMNGVQVEAVMKMKSAGGAAAPAMPQMTGAQRSQMQAAMEKLKAMQQQGGPGAAAAAQAMARMGNLGGGGAPAGDKDSMMEVTMESSDFSTASIPDSVFAIPAGYRKVEPKY